MKILGLTGGIGSGKSTVSRMLAEAGFTIVDADKIARLVVEFGQPALTELAEAFGPDILSDDGTLNRGLLARRAFASPEATAQLNSITHPRIEQERRRQFAQAEKAGANWVVYDMPLLIEQGAHKDVDYVVVVDVPVDIRVERLIRSRGMDESDARKRIAAQVGDDERRKVADTILDNSGSLEELEAQVTQLIATLRG
ncbi:dephospho-CoA kinase [Corynebacterium renale]|uniref:Dephospho-CoA kinase n=1 Tax=Corynebacterium renale TaxID=1724 RepID=A0A2A9DSB7_9CORY|nr:dephospho-CoA kinase [Corynebacterium renale]PFG28809.1 dephospho-CoA kinase [Corynebacterium renale]SQI25706.1 dephospho-CoA kinase [Corynebacterium renale]